MSHAYHDRVSLEMARIVAAGLPDHPEWLDLARTNLDNWTRRNHDAPRLLRNYDEWRRLLDLRMSDICALLVACTDQSRRLRHNSPFAGVLSPQEVWDIKRRLRDEPTAA
jgi:hypothetical protein